MTTTTTTPARSSATAPTRASGDEPLPTGLVLILAMIGALAVIVAFVFYLASRMPV